MTYWLNVLRGEWGSVENEQSLAKASGSQDMFRLSSAGASNAGRLIPARDGSMTYLLDRETFLVTFESLELYARPLAYSPVTPA
jgi:hypothetical protein